MTRSPVRVFARFVGVLFTILGIWVFGVNVIELSYSGAVLVWILAAGLLGAVGGVMFLLSFDGPARFRIRKVRLYGWTGMLVLGLLPWSFAFVMLAFLLLTIPTLRLSDTPNRPNQPAPV